MPTRMMCTTVAGPISLLMSSTPHMNGDNQFFGIVGRDPTLERIVETIRTAAPSDASILIEGESGTGKKLIANAIRAQSHRGAGLLVHVNCASVPPELIEAELFGSQKSACNSVDGDKRTLLERANGGTLMLDEIAAMPAHLQARLFRVL